MTRPWGGCEAGGRGRGARRVRERGDRVVEERREGCIRERGVVGVREDKSPQRGF